MSSDGERTVAQEMRRVGLVLSRPSRVLGEEAFYHEFLEGLERVLTPAGISVLVRVVTDGEAEAAVYRRWADERRVDGVILTDLVPGDGRVDLVSRLGLPAVVLGDPSTADGLPTVWTDDAGFAQEAVRFLADLGHRVIGQVSGPIELAHTQLRRGGFETEAEACGLTLHEAAGDYSAEAGRAAAEALLALEPRPTALVFDNDLMAIGALAAIAGRGLAVPADVSVVAWDDSALCQLAVPALSAMSHDVGRIGELAAAALTDAMSGRPAKVYQAPPAHIVPRESTANR